MANLEKLCGAGGFTSTGVTVGEIYLAGMLYQATLCCTTLLDASPKVKSWFTTLTAKQEFKTVVAGKGGGGFELTPYFVN